MQNERHDDWTPVLTTIRHQLMGYRESLLNFHRARAPPAGPPPPRAVLSSAAQGNFLEVLNISMNGEVFSGRLLPGTPLLSGVGLCPSSLCRRLRYGQWQYPVGDIFMRVRIGIYGHQRTGRIKGQVNAGGSDASQKSGMKPKPKQKKHQIALKYRVMVALVLGHIVMPTF